MVKWKSTFLYMILALLICNREIERLKADTFKYSQILFKERQTEANLMMEITGAQAAVKNLMGTINTYGSI